MPDHDATEQLSAHGRIAREHLHERSDVSQPRLSPDGAHVACVVATVDLDDNAVQRRIWLDGEPITAGPHDGDPCWSPDGRWLAFTSRRGEQESESTLHVLPIGGPGEVRTVCTMPDGLGDVSWSPDGTTLAFTSRTRDARYDAPDVRSQPPRQIERFFSRLNGENWVFDRPKHVHVVRVDGTGGPRNLTPGEFQHSGTTWLADSSAVITSGQRHEDWDRDLARDLYRIDLDGTITELTHQTGLYGAASVSPDGRHVAFVGVDDPLLSPQNSKIGVMTADGSDRRWISEAHDRPFGSLLMSLPPCWIDDEQLVVWGEDRGDTAIYRLGLDGREPERLTPTGRMVTGFDVAAGVVATTVSTVDRPAELFVERNGATERLTDLNPSRRGWERFTVPCTDGSDEIDAWIMRPDLFEAGQRYPVLLNVHGGPFTQYGETYFDEAQMQAAAGFVVVMSNPRGSSGRHAAWGQAITGPKHPRVPGPGWGTVDVDDVMAVLDAALARFEFCDPGRVGMLGGSYGGYMATTLAARYGDRFRAICSERAVNNMLTEEWSSDIATYFRSQHGPDAAEDPDEYLRMSPITLARDIHVPMLLIHSEEDWRCPINQAEELWVLLRLLGRDVTFYRFPGENHELSRGGSPVHRRMRAEIILDWFAERLAPADD